MSLNSIFRLFQELHFIFEHAEQVKPSVDFAETVDRFCGLVGEKFTFDTASIHSLTLKLWCSQRDCPGSVIPFRKAFSDSLAAWAVTVGVGYVVDQVAVRDEQHLLARYDQSELFEEKLSVLADLRGLYLDKYLYGGCVGLEWMKLELEQLAFDAGTAHLYSGLISFSRDDRVAVLHVPVAIPLPQRFHLSQDDPRPPIIHIDNGDPETPWIYVLCGDAYVLRCLNRQEVEPLRVSPNKSPESFFQGAGI